MLVGPRERSIDETAAQAEPVFDPSLLRHRAGIRVGVDPLPPGPGPIARACPPRSTSTSDDPPNGLRVSTLSRLRWLALSGQTCAVLFTRFALGFPLPLTECLIVIGLSVICNSWLRLLYPVTHRLDDWPATALLGYDLLQLSALLFLTGGLENPFSMLFLAPVMISAASLSPARTVLLGGAVVVAATLLVRWHLPLPWRPGEVMRLPFLFSAGIWCAVVLGVGFIGIYTSRVAEEARQLSQALAATELVLAASSTCRNSTGSRPRPRTNSARRSRPSRSWRARC